MTGSEIRALILEEVRKCVCQDRQATYRDAEENFADIAAKWNIQFADMLKDGARFEAYHVAVAMIDVKTCRIKGSPHYADNWVDAAGYAVCGGGIQRKAVEISEKETVQ